MNSRIALCAVALGATALVAGDASAKGGKSTRTQTIEMTRPSGAPDADAQGTVDVKGGAGGQTVLHLSKLAKRTKFEIRDSVTGAVIGRVKTDRKGRATFNLTKSLAKAASSNGSDAGATGDVSTVDVVDPTTGDTVLTGDTQPTPPSPADGYDYYSSDAGDTADVFMSTDGEDNDMFSASFYPAFDPNSDPTTTTYTYYDINLDTADGDSLPLGAASVTDLAGRAFEIHAADGTVVLSGDLPEMQTYDFSDYGDYGNYDDFGDYGDFGDFGGYWGGCPGMGDSSSSDTTDPSTGDAVTKHRGGAKSAKAKKHRGSKTTSTDGFSLFIADANGDLQDAGQLVTETDDFSSDFPFGDFGQGYGDFGDGGFTITIQITFAPTDGSFDFGSLFDSLFGGGFDPSQWGGASDDGSSAAKHHRR